jgi:hypothetical protein
MEFASWRKSSFSDGGNSQSDCVEIAFAASAVGVRDSKDPELTPLAFPASAWRPFLDTVVRLGAWQAR